MPLQRNSKYFLVLNMKQQSVIHLEENVGENIHDPDVDKELLDIMQKALKKISQINFINIKKKHLSKCKNNQNV